METVDFIAKYLLIDVTFGVKYYKGNNSHLSFGCAATGHVVLCSADKGRNFEEGRSKNHPGISKGHQYTIYFAQYGVTDKSGQNGIVFNSSFPLHLPLVHL